MMGSPKPPPLPAAPPVIDPVAEKAKAENAARKDAITAMREQAKRRAQSGTLLAGNLDKSATLGTTTLLGS